MGGFPPSYVFRHQRFGASAYFERDYPFGARPNGDVVCVGVSGR